MSKRVYSVLLFLAQLLLFGGKEFGPAQSLASAPEKEWTVLLYMAADAKDLSAPALDALRKVEKALPPHGAASGPRANLVVQLDVFAPPGIKRIYVESGKSSVVEQLAEGNLSSEESLTRFLRWGIRRYPAAHYMVVLWGHGLGWLPRQTRSSGARLTRKSLPGGIAIDESQHKVLDIPSLRNALLSASRAELSGRAFDVFVADTCLMQSIEVAAELYGVVRFVVASEAKFDYTGLPYESLMAELNAQEKGRARAEKAATCRSGDAACDIAARIPFLTQRSATGLSAQFILSTLDLSALHSRLQPAMYRLGAVLTKYLREDTARAITVQDLLAIRSGAIARGRSLPDFPGGTRDIGVFLRALADAVQHEAGRLHTERSLVTQELLLAIAEVRRALATTILAIAAGSRYREDRYVGYSGLSIWLPSSAQELAERGPFFRSSRFYRASGHSLGRPSASGQWDGWLEQLFAPVHSR